MWKMKRRRIALTVVGPLEKIIFIKTDSLVFNIIECEFNLTEMLNDRGMK